ncbi:MAG: four helix bundle protein [Phycisphaerae bacterium]
MKDFRDLNVWRKSHQLVFATCCSTVKFPKEKINGLTARIRRCGASIPANMAEGCGRDGNAECARFLNIAMGSASELECHFLLARDLGLMAAKICEQIFSQVVQVKRMLVPYSGTSVHFARMFLNYRTLWLRPAKKRSALASLIQKLKADR